MNIEINQKVKSPLSSSQINKLVKQSVKNTCLPVGMEKWDISLAIVGPAAIRQFNKTYRKKDKITDVLSFKYEPYQGEIVICPSYVNYNKEKMARMIIHGVLHLQGYDHKNKTEEEKMRKQEDKILSHVKL